jgi:sulfur-oxidizing protein SoxY
MVDTKRRIILRGVGAAGVLTAAAPVGWIPLAQAIDRNTAAFEAKSTHEAFKALGISPSESREIQLKAPDIAENGAVVPLEITSNLPGTESIAVVIDKNPFPYVGSFDVSKGALPFVALRVKMGETSNVRAVVTAAGKTYSTTKEVKITIGGCGG